MPVAIVGIGCRFPGGVINAPSLWKLLNAEVDAITEIPESRIDTSRYYDVRPATPGRMMTRWGGFLDGIEDFDASFFGISPREAERLDPQQRLLLETAWEALEDAGQDVQKLEGVPVGIFIGQWLSDFESRLFSDPESVDFYMTTGSGRYAASGRLSFTFGLRGPALTLDTACSSSLTAVHLAVRSIRSGESHMAIAGGANVILQPQISIAYSQSLMMAPDGRCKFGDAAANGYVRSEGAGVVVLKPLDSALANGDRVYAVIRGSAINNDGRSSGSMGTPSRMGQEELLRSAYRDAGCSPGDVRYVEAHGTGTRAGDPIEIGALSAVLSEGRPSGRKALVGSIKTNLGHTEAAAGVAGLIKAALALHHGRIPATLNCGELNPSIDWESIPCEIVREATAWTGDHRLAGVSAFGIAGSNAHVVLEAAPTLQAASHLASEFPSEGPFLLPLSARSPEALHTLARSYAALIASPDAKSLSGICASAALHRSQLEQRAAFVAESRADLVDRLSCFAIGEEDLAQASGQISPRGRIAFVFPGQGSQWRGMARELFSKEPTFRASIERTEAALRGHVEWSLIAHLLEQGGHGDFDDISIIQPVLVAVEVALADLWRSRGIEPDALIGHSMGEIAAAYIAGVLSLEEAVTVVCNRSALMRQTSGNGAMAVVELSMLEATELLSGYPGQPSVAVNSGPRTSVISGETPVISAVVAELEQKGVFARMIQVDVASHSSQMDPLVPRLIESLPGMQPRSAGIQLYSTVNAAPVEGQELGAHYWGRNLRQSVLFHQTVSAMLGDGIDTFIEMSPHPTLLNAIQQTAKAVNREVLTLHSLRREEPAQQEMLGSLGELFVNGHPVDWQRIYPKDYERADLPNYPWQRERYWPKEVLPANSRRQVNQEIFLAAPLALSTQADTYVWEIEVGVAGFSYLADHKVNGAVVFPAAAFIEIAIEAAAQVFGSDETELSEITLDSGLVLSNSDGRTLQVLLEPGPIGSLSFIISSKGKGYTDKWTQHARGLVRTTSLPAEAEPGDGISGAQSRITADAHYSAMKSLGLEYGAAFRGVRELHKEPGKVLANVVLPEGVSCGRYLVHPALLDSCLQAGVELVLESHSGGTLVPVSIERVHVTRRIDSSSSLRVRGSFNPDRLGKHSMCVDLRIEDAAGRELLRIDGLAFAPIQSSRAGSKQTMYSVIWREEPLAVNRSSSPITWSVLADRRGVGAELGALLGPAHRQNLLFDGASLHARLEELMQSPGQQGIVHLWSLDALPPDAHDHSLAAARDLGCLSALKLAQVAASSTPVRRRRICLVTSGAQAVLDGEMPAVEQAPLWGLGRVIANEHPELFCTLIDLSSRPTPVEIDALARELQTDMEETQIAIRGEKRFVARLTPMRLDKAAEATVKTAADKPYRVHIDTPGILDGLVLRADRRRKPAAHEVEIEVEATGLNFMNVMSALGVCPGYPGGVGPLGIECAGRITAVGGSVTDLCVGDKVMAVALDSLAFHCIADACLVRKIPVDMSFAAAASIPISFLTAHYALHSLARVQSGERVLIHAATGGVGLAALQLARLAGAEPFATAGTDEKRELLARMDLAHVFDSRSLAFRDQIMERTGGKGVDIVLNSLAGDFIPAGLSTLAAYGRFVELGKVDIYRNSRLGLSPFQRNLSFFAVDLDRMIRERPAKVSKILDDVMALLKSAAIQPLPVTRFPVSQSAEAFRVMAASRHIGKIVVTAHDPEARIIGRNQLDQCIDRTCVITGGLGGLGLAVARRWVETGGRSIALIGRREAGTDQVEALKFLETAGATLRSFVADVTSADQLRAVFTSIVSTMAPISTVIHAAGILEDATILQQNAAGFARAMAPKVEGAWNLYKCLEKAPEVHLVLFSSVASLLGLPGQSNYAAGNAFLDALAAYRRAKGGRATAINWGPWASIGLAAASENRGGRLSLQGVKSFSPDEALDELERILVHQPSQVSAVDIDWEAYAASGHPSAKSPFLSELSIFTRAEPGVQCKGKARDVFAAAVAGTPRRAAIETFIKGHVAQVLRQAPSRIETTKPFRSLGLDSLMGLELRNRLETELSLQLPASVVWNYPTVQSLAPHLASLLGLSIDPAADEFVTVNPEDEIESLLREIENLPPSEAGRLLELEEIHRLENE